MKLDVSEHPPTTTPRRRLIKFTRGELIDILTDHCRTNGLEVGIDCERRVQGVDSHSHGRGDSVTLVIDG